MADSAQAQDIDIFISYSHKDHGIAERMDEYLCFMGLSTWRDVLLKPGIHFERNIQTNLENSRICVVLISQSYLDSEYCQNEVGFAVAHGISLFPCMLDNSHPSGFLANRSYLDLSKVVSDPQDDKFQNSLYDVCCSIRKQLFELRQEDLKPYLVEFYERLAKYPIGNDRTIATLTPYIEETEYYTCLSYVKSAMTISRMGSRRVATNILDHLANQKSCKSVFDAHKCENYLPIWLLYPNDVARLGSCTDFDVIPNALIANTSSFCNGSIIKTQVIFPTKIKIQQTSGQIPYVLPSPIQYRSVEFKYAKQLGWVDVKEGREVYVYVLSRGIYRLANVFSDYLITQLALSKYLGIEATRIRLSGGSETLSTDRKQSHVLQMMYVGQSLGSMEFLLFNDLESIAVVRNLRVIVHSVSPRQIESESRRVGASLPVYRFDVTLRPDSEEISITTGEFKYSPGDIDKFVIGFHSLEAGYDYEVSLKLDWFDVRSGSVQTIETPKEIVKFPKYS